MIGVILAAGMSSRFGECKLTYQVNGRSILEHVCQALNQVCEANVVLGHNHKKVRSVLPSFVNQIMINENYQEGMHSSIQYAVEYALFRQEDLLLTLGDLLYVDTNDYEKLKKAFHGQCVFSSFNSTYGPPCIISYSNLKQIQSSQIRFGLKNMIDAFDTVMVENAGRDIDVKHDLNKHKLHYSISEISP